MKPVRTIAAGLTVAAVAIFATAPPASAHDELISSDPPADSRLEDAPSSVTLQFSGTLLTLGDTASGAVVLIVDEDGTDWADGDPEVVRDTVTVDVAPGMPDAGYQVRWQVVSEDGHPISGVVPFTVGDAVPLTTASGTTSPAETALADQTEPEPNDALRIVLIAAIGAAIAAALFVLIHFLRRARTARASVADGDDAHAEL